MTLTEARKLVRQIRKEAPSLQITGVRRFGEGRPVSYAIEAVDTITGYPLVVHTAEAWLERRGN